MATATTIKAAQAPALKKKPKTLRQLLANTPIAWLKNAKDTKIISAKTTILGAKTSVQRKRLEAIARSDTTAGLRHLLYIESLEGNLVSVGPCKVSCGCGAFTYTFEVALFTHGNADIIHSNGMPPNFTNPMLIPGLCKHLAKLSLYAIKRGL